MAVCSHGADAVRGRIVLASSILIALRVPASPERTFEAFVYEIGEWWQPNSLFDFTVGKQGRLAFEPGASGRLVETYEDGTEFEVGRIIDWQPPRFLAFTWRQASFGEGMGTEVRVSFEAVGQETRVTVEHTGWDSVPQQHAARHGFPLGAFQARHAEWWQLLLGRLRRRVSSGGESTPA